MCQPILTISIYYHFIFISTHKTATRIKSNLRELFTQFLIIFLHFVLAVCLYLRCYISVSHSSTSRINCFFISCHKTRYIKQFHRAYIAVHEAYPTILLHLGYTNPIIPKNYQTPYTHSISYAYYPHLYRITYPTD